MAAKTEGKSGAY